MDIAAIAIKKRLVTLVLTAAMLVAGLWTYQDMSRLEDPEFTIKEALVVTPYAGASALEVEQEVSDRLEKAVQQLGQLERVSSKSERGLSTLTVTVKDNYDRESLPQVWDELRRKVDDVQRELPPGAGPSIVLDDYGDVYSAFLVVTGDGYSYAELKNYVDQLRRELLLVRDVGKITTFGERQEAIFVEFNSDRLSQLGIAPASIIEELRQKGLATDAGRARVGKAFVTLAPSGGLSSIGDFQALLIHGGDGRQFQLGDLARIRRGYVEPTAAEIRFDGRAGIGLGISTVSGGNVVTMGEALQARMAELEGQRPVGMEFGIVSQQSESVTTAISGFVESLLQAVAIVVAVLLLFMGLRSGLLIGFVLLLTIAGSFLFLDPMGVALERISLGALIIALGMLVDMVLITIMLFNTLRQPLVIWLCVPLALIGVTAGLLVSGQPFGFMALLGFLSLIGMLIKNAIVLIEQIDLECEEGKALLPAIVDAGASRLRPVAMAALTTALGMIPLVFDAFFVSMAITIIGGLLFATVLTMVVLPVFYALIYRAP